MQHNCPISFDIVEAPVIESLSCFTKLLNWDTQSIQTVFVFLQRCIFCGICHSILSKSPETDTVITTINCFSLYCLTVGKQNMQHIIPVSPHLSHISYRRCLSSLEQKNVAHNELEITKIFKSSEEFKALLTVESCFKYIISKCSDCIAFKTGRQLNNIKKLMLIKESLINKCNKYCITNF